MTIPQSEILDRLKRLVAERTELDVRKLAPNALLAELGIDSFTLIEVVFALEEEFGVSIKMDEVRLERVQDVVDAVTARLSAATT